MYCMKDIWPSIFTIPLGSWETRYNISKCVKLAERGEEEGCFYCIHIALKGHIWPSRCPFMNQRDEQNQACVSNQLVTCWVVYIFCCKAYHSQHSLLMDSFSCITNYKNLLKWENHQKVVQAVSLVGCCGLQLCQSLTRGRKVQSRREREIWCFCLQFREEKVKPEIPFPSFQRRKRNLKKRFSTFEKRKRKGFSFLKFREEKENLF